MSRFNTVIPFMALAAAAFAGPLGALTGAVPVASTLWPVLEFLLLVAAVFASVHHADVIAHRTGEPVGTLVLTVAVTVIEVALILSIMLAGEAAPTLARDTVFAVIMLVLNGLVGLCLVQGGLRHKEQGFRLPGASSYLVVLMPLAVFSLVMPNFTTGAPGPFYTRLQLGFVIAATLLLYGVFLYVQTVRHRDYFLSDSGAAGPEGEEPSNREAAWSAGLLLAGLAGVVLLAKHLSGTLRAGVLATGAPPAAIGILVALLVLLPEGLAATRAARRNELQKSLNLALGSSLATIGLTIPAVGVISAWLDSPVALGLDLKDEILLLLTFGVSLVTFSGGRTNILPGFVHLVILAAYVFLTLAP